MRTKLDNRIHRTTVTVNLKGLFGKDAACNNIQNANNATITTDTSNLYIEYYENE